METKISGRKDRKTEKSIDFKKVYFQSKRIGFIIEKKIRTISFGGML
jgi:hypothetical protein